MFFRYSAVIIGAIFSLCQAQTPADDYFSLKSANLVQKRYYFIKRLERPMKILCALGAHHKAGFVDSDSLVHFVHPEIRRTIRENSGVHTVATLRKVWEEFLAYKFINDEVFEKEIVVILLLLYKSLLSGVFEKNPDIIQLLATIDNCINFQHKKKLFMYKSIDHLDSLSSTVSHYNPLLSDLLIQNHNAPGLRQNDDPRDVHITMSSLITLLDGSQQEDCSNLVVNNTMRFYHIQRLIKSLFLVSKNEEKFCKINDRYVDFFSHDCIKKCCLDMAKSDSFDPLFIVWQRFVAYDFINDDHMLREFIKLLIVMYADCLDYSLAKNVPPVDSQNMVELYDKIAALPIPQLLDLLDDMVHQFDQLSHSYELDNKQLSWEAWFKKYWWAPPIIIVSLIISLIKHRKLLTSTLQG